MAVPGSPPTRRVIAVVELLVESDRARSVSEIAAALSLARATVTAVLAELTDAGWLIRDDDLRYRPGPALARLAPESPAALGAVQTELAALAAAAGCGATLSRIDSDRLTVVAKQYSGARVVPGLSVGQSLPLAYPAGAAVMPWRAEAERRAWLATVSGPVRRAAPALLRFVADNGYAVFRPDADDAGLVDVLADLLGAVGSEVLQPQLRSRVLRQLSRLTARPYTEAEIASAESLPVSYLSAPVFDGAGAPYEVQIGPLSPAVGPDRRAEYIAAIRAGAQAMSAALGERRPST